MALARKEGQTGSAPNKQTAKEAPQEQPESEKPNGKNADHIDPVRGIRNTVRRRWEEAKQKQITKGKNPTVQPAPRTTPIIPAATLHCQHASSQGTTQKRAQPTNRHVWIQDFMAKSWTAEPTSLRRRKEKKK
uniref:CsbD family protein n=1 Tax=Panagrellus redivivus TaxID=6233 RepID=A0A7E4VFM9_PANRE